MTVLKGGRHAWASTYCPGCKCIVQYQAEDVVESRPPVTVRNVHPDRVYSIECKEGHAIEIARQPCL